LFSAEKVMKLNLLLDLDGTLLINEFNSFLPSYLEALGKHMRAYVEPERMVPALLNATNKMVEEASLDQTLRETFDAAFYPSLGLDRTEIQPVIDAFYKEVFPSLRKLTSLQPEAKELVQEAQRRGYRVGIATNPLFPRTALEQRVRWAGIDPAEDGIALIPSYETFHFAKPNPAFITEFLAQLGWPDGPVLFVGNDPQLDLAPARQIGIRTFYVHEDGGPVPGSDPLLTPGGSLEDILPWIDSQSEEDLLPDLTSPEALLAVLKATPAALHTLAQMLPDEAWTYCPTPGEWCLAEIICHLRDVDAEVNMPRFLKMLHEVNPFLPGFDTDSWVSERQYIAQDCVEALTAFLANRKKLVQLIESMAPEDWMRKARHAIFGPTELREIVKIIAGHDRLHVNQVIKTIP
jgi:FMN phosphatase YigB (HAD superfamily)